MPALTRRRSTERQDCWHVYYGDVHVGTIAIRAGVPVDVDQWGWNCGFYPTETVSETPEPFLLKTIILLPLGHMEMA
jgi:hypothetical protein